MAKPTFNFIDLSDTGSLEVTSNRNIDHFVDLNGHNMLIDSNSNHYLWGKNPGGGGNVVHAIWDTVTVLDVTQRAVRFFSVSDYDLTVTVKLNCDCESNMELAVGMLDFTSNNYSEIGRADIDGYTQATFAKDISLVSRQSFYIIVWQTELGDSIRILDYHIDGARWHSTVTFG